mgnify:CR=1 FL=1
MFGFLAESLRFFLFWGWSGRRGRPKNPKQNSKRSFAGRLGDEMKDSAFYLDVGKADGQIPLIELATNYINKNYPDPTLRPDIDSFLRTFRNKKKQKYIKIFAR